MKTRTCTLIIPMALLLAAPPAWSEQAGDDDEVTITIIEDAETLMPDAVIKIIALPESAQGQAKGHDTANQAREKQQRKDGLETAEQARQAGRDAAESASDNARNHREDTGRPENPGRPDNPGPPGG